MILTIGLIKADLVTAGQAIEYFEATSNKNIKNIAAYHLQQAAGSRYDIGFTARIDTLKRTYSEIENWIERMKT